MRAIGIIRQSRGREESVSPAEQRDRIVAACEREGLDLIDVHEEIDVSGGTPLAQREGLRAAVEAIEGGSASVVVVAYFDRLFRSLVVQAEVVQRVEAAGGRILAADIGEVSEASPAQWVSGTMLGMMAEYQRRSIRERSGAAQRMAVAEGRPPFGQFPPGLVCGDDGKLVPNAEAPAVVGAFQIRREGATIAQVRTFLAEQGIERTYRGVQGMLASRLYLGELHFGDLVNLEAHEPIIDRALFDAVQKVRTTRGTRPKSDRLLARQGVLRCGTCGARLVIGFRSTKDGKRYDFYRCVPTSDCPRRVTISADIVEGYVVERVKRALAGLRGSASVEQDARGAEDALLLAQQKLDSAISAFAEFDEPSALERLRELRDLRDAAREQAAHLGNLSAALTVSVEDWDRFTLEEKRTLVRQTVEWVRVAPGRGTDRLSCKLLV